MEHQDPASQTARTKAEAKRKLIAAGRLMADLGYTLAEAKAALDSQRHTFEPRRTEAVSKLMDEFGVNRYEAARMLEYLDR